MKSTFMLFENVLPLVNMLCELYFFVVSVLAFFVVSFSFPARIVWKVRAVTPATVPGFVCGNAHPVMPRLAHRGRRSALNEQVRTPQLELDLLQYIRQQDLIDLRIALRALRWLTSAIQDIIREREQRTELDLIEGNV